MSLDNQIIHNIGNIKSISVWLNVRSVAMTPSSV